MKGFFKNSSGEGIRSLSRGRLKRFQDSLRRRWLHNRLSQGLQVSTETTAYIYDFRALTGADVFTDPTE